MWIAAALRRSSLAVISVNAAGFAVTATTGSHKITDLCGTAGFVASAAVALRHAHSLQPLPLRSAVLGIAVAAWSVRLGGYLGYRISQTGDDPRLRPYFRDKVNRWPFHFDANITEFLTYFNLLLTINRTNRFLTGTDRHSPLSLLASGVYNQRGPSLYRSPSRLQLQRRRW